MISETTLLDPERLEALRQSELLDTPPEEAFDRVARLASMLLNTPVALVSLVDENRQFFKSSVGVPEPVASSRETPLTHSFCQHVVSSGKPLIVTDARTDRRLLGNQAITELNVTSYVGIPLRLSSGHVLGSFCVIDFKPRVWSDTEIGIVRTLAESIMTEIELRIALAEIKRENVERLAMLERERRIAEALQRPLLLAPAEDAFPGICIGTFYEALWHEAEVGGDFFDAFVLPGDRIGIVVGDILGKGLAAAAHASQVKDVLRMLLWEYPDRPGYAISRLNDFLCVNQVPDDAGDYSFATLCVSVIDTRSGELNFVVVGCEPPLLLRASGEVEMVEGSGLPVGIQPNEVYEVIVAAIEPGDTVLLLTDGITEARQDGETFGYARMVESAKRALSMTSLRDMGRAVVDEARTFAGGSLQDDACILIVQRRSERLDPGLKEDTSRMVNSRE